MCIMSEPKRANLTSITVHKNKKEKPVIKSVRFNLTLTESNEKSCPIFNYRELLESSTEEYPATNGLEPFKDDDDDADVERLAKQFEAKYGCGSYTSKKKKKKYRGDWADMGAGYDETDSFIDNTDAYDEIVPQDTSPEHGGFYINSGSLEFKQQEISDMDDISSSKSLIQKNRKRIIEDDNSDIENQKGTSVEKKLKLDSDVEKAVKKIDSSGNKSNGIKKKTVTVKELLKEKRDDTEINGDEIKQKLTKDTQNNSEQKKTVLNNSTSINDAIESVVNAGRAPNHDESSKDGSTSSESSATASSENSGYSDSSDDDESQNKNNDNGTTNNDNSNNNTSEIIKLPDNLPEEIIKIVDAIKEASKNVEGKNKFYSGSVNKKLLRLHHLCRSLKSFTRSQVYGYLASAIKCTKDTLIRRTKKIVLEKYSNALEDSVSRLQECINQAMPAIIENYERECQKVNEKNSVQDRVESPNGEKTKPLRLPKRKFQWNDQIRKILSEIVTNKRQCFIVEKNRKESFDDYLENFYREKLIFLWPDCWMTHTHLMRESIQYFTKTERSMSKYNKKSVSNENNQVKLPQTANIQNQKVVEGNSKQKPLPKVILDSINAATNKLPIPVGPPSLSIKPISQTEGTNIIKNNVKLGSGVTIEPIVNKSSAESKRNSNLTTTYDPIIALKQAMACENIVKSQKSNSRNNSPIPPVNPLDLNAKSKPQKSDDVKKSKADQNVNTWKLPELLVKPPSILLDTENYFQSKTLPNATTHENSSVTSSAKHKNPKEIETKVENEDDKDVEIIENVEVIEIKDDDSPPPVNSKLKTIEAEAKIKRKKKKLKPDSIQHKAAEMLSKIIKEKESSTHLSISTGSDLISKLITNQLNNFNNAVSITRKSNSDPDDKLVTDPSTNISDVIQVMKDLKALEELTGQSEKSKDSNDILSRHSNSPVSVITVNANRQSPIKSNSVSSICKSGGGDSLGFQDVFQKHLFQDSIDCKNSATNNFSTSEGKIKISSNSIEIFPYIRSFNSTTILPISTSQKYLQNLTINSCRNVSNVQSQNIQQTGAALKNDVILFPNFLYEYQLYKKTGSAQRSPPIDESSLHTD